jgi:serine/threonine protein phosphatase 1
MRTFAIGDIHGAAKALEQCLERSGFDRTEDRLIVLGDVCDGWPETPRTVDILTALPNKVIVIGNHDQWAIEWLEMGRSPIIWTEQGGRATIDAYLLEAQGCAEGEIPAMVRHREFWQQGVYFHQDSKGRLYLHGGVPYEGFSKGARAEEYPPESLMWDRSLAEAAMNAWKAQEPMRGRRNSSYGIVFLGHTTTSILNHGKPIVHDGVALLDQGGGWEGRLSIMDVDTLGWWQSDVVKDLYPNHRDK